MLKPWERISREEKCRNPWWTYCLDKIRFPSGKEGEYHVIHQIGSVVVVPVQKDGRFLLVRQYRYLQGRESLELPCGGMKEGSLPIDDARRELIEETGMDGTLTSIGRFIPFIGISDEVTHVFIATGLFPSSQHQKDEEEEFEQVSLSPDEFEDHIQRGEITHGHSLSAWALARPYILKGIV